MASISDKVALKRLEDKGLTGFQKFAPIRNQSLCKKCGRDRIFLFTNEDKMIISPADGDLPAVLGECEIIGEEIPIPLKEWLMGTTEEIEAYQLGVAKAPSAPPSGREYIAPMVECRWGQLTPYNISAPSKGDVRCQIGCSAVAVAQVMYYWGVQGVDGVKYHRGFPSVSKYTSVATDDNGGNKETYDMTGLSPITLFDYKNLLPKYTSSSTDVQRSAAAELLKYISRAIKMQFHSTSGSAAPHYSNVERVLKNYLHFGDSVQYVGWNEQTLYNNIAARQPVIMGGSGHMFVVDGYNPSTGMYHFNFGWNDSDDPEVNWFLPSAITPNGHNYSKTKNIMIGIRPPYLLGDVNKDGRINVSDIMKIINIANQSIPDVSSMSSKDKSRLKKLAADYPWADVNSDGIITQADIDRLVKHILGTDPL